MGDFIEIMQFIGSVVVLIFDILSDVNFGEFSLLQIFLSILLLRVVIWFIARILGINIDTSLESSAESFRAGLGSRYGSVSKKYSNYRHKNKMRLSWRYTNNNNVNKNTIKFKDYFDLHNNNRGGR